LALVQILVQLLLAAEAQVVIHQQLVVMVALVVVVDTMEHKRVALVHQGKVMLAVKAKAQLETLRQVVVVGQAPLAQLAEIVLALVVVEQVLPVQ
jgi:hypothetical protein